MAKQYHLSPFGVFVHPWVNKPDTKYNADGVFKTGLTLSGQEAQSFKDMVDGEADAALQRFFETDEGKRIKNKKEWTVYRPYSEDTDENGNPTGYITFDFKQNAKIKLKDGTTKDIQVGIKDAKDKDMHKPVFGGSEGRVMFAFRDIPMKSTKQVGTRMDMAQVQVIKLASSSGPGFGAVAGGYTEDEDADSHSGDAEGGDY